MIGIYLYLKEGLLKTKLYQSCGAAPCSVGSGVFRPAPVSYAQAIGGIWKLVVTTRVEFYRAIKCVPW